MTIEVVAGRNCSRRPAAASPAGIPSPISVITAGMLAMAETRLSPALAADIRNRLQEVMNLLDAPDAEDPEGVPVNVLIGFNSPAAPAEG
jgi:hypothetical protein